MDVQGSNELTPEEILNLFEESIHFPRRIPRGSISPGEVLQAKGSFGESKRSLGFGIE